MAHQIDPIVAQITQDFEFSSRQPPAVTPEQLAYAPELGFLVVRHEAVLPAETEPPEDTGKFVTVAGFITYTWPSDTPDILNPITDYSALPDCYRSAGQLGKGVGTRVYNTSAALRGYPGLVHENHMYAVTLDTQQLLDMRKPADVTLPGKLARIASHAGRLVQARTRGLQAMAEQVHASYGNNQAVLFSQPPNAARRQAMRRGPRQPQDVPAQFIILRDSQLAIRRIATRPSNVW